MFFSSSALGAAAALFGASSALGESDLGGPVGPRLLRTYTWGGRHRGKAAGLRSAAGAEIGRSGGRIEPRLGVDQEAAGGRDFVARVEALEHRIIFAVSRPEFHFHAFEQSRLALHVHDLLFPLSITARSARRETPAPSGHVDLSRPLGEKVRVRAGPLEILGLLQWSSDTALTLALSRRERGPSAASFVGLDAFQRRVDRTVANIPGRNSCCGLSSSKRTRLVPRGRVEPRVNQRELAGEGAIGEGLDRGFDRLAGLQKRHVLLVYVGLDPHRRQVGHLEQVIRVSTLEPATIFLSTT